MLTLSVIPWSLRPVSRDALMAVRGGTFRVAPQIPREEVEKVRTKTPCARLQSAMLPAPASPSSAHIMSITLKKEKAGC